MNIQTIRSQFRRIRHARLFLIMPDRLPQAEEANHSVARD